MIIVDCQTCGYSREVDASAQIKLAQQNEKFSQLCLDCRRLERERTRPTHVPAEAIAEAIRKLKEKQVA